MDIDFDDEHANLRNISRLRSNAFWELHRSVAENGEGLVRRMRDYEHSRSRTDVYLKAKEAQKRGRKRSSVINLARRVQHVRLHSDSDHGDDEEEDDEEDDEVQIFAGELPRLSLAGMHYPPKRSMSLDVKDTSGRGCQLATNRRYSRRGSSPPFIHLEREELSPGTISSPTPIPSSGSRTEKAIAALSLAMANGAGGITDYGSVLSVASNLPLHDECQVGEMQQNYHIK
ncbi:hypothetical protein H0H92_001511 [Tricholoma furcatifolium]|nr:hypothetical protein H0H92_001511 [Tricholoma furcatifolium]